MKSSMYTYTNIKEQLSNDTLSLPEVYAECIWRIS